MRHLLPCASKLPCSHFNLHLRIHQDSRLHFYVLRPRPVIFLYLQAVGLPGAYPFPSLSSCTHTLLSCQPLPSASSGLWALASPEPGSVLAGGDGGWGCCLALVVYWLADRGLVPHNTAQGIECETSTLKSHLAAHDAIFAPGLCFLAECLISGSRVDSPHILL